MFCDTLTALNDHIAQKPVDAFVCCASYEDRSRSIAESIEPKQIKHSLIGFNQDFASSSKKNLEYLESRFEGAFNTIELDTGNPLKTADSFAAVLSEILDDSIERILVDITAFTRESLLILLRYLVSNFRKNASVEFIYANAKEYSIGYSPEKKWLSKGNREIRSILGYPGSCIPSKGDHLIVLLGFEDERALGLIHEFEPSLISVGIGDENQWASREHQQTNLHHLKRLKSVLGPFNEFTFNGYNARETKDAIHDLISNFQNLNTILAPMNTKISTIGAAAVAIENTSVQICYAQADFYNIEHYSTPGKHFFHFLLDDVLSINYMS